MEVENKIETNNTTINQEIQFLIEQFCIECRAIGNCEFMRNESRVSTRITAVIYKDHNCDIIGQFTIYFTGGNTFVKNINHENRFVHFYIFADRPRNYRSFNQIEVIR